MISLHVEPQTPPLEWREFQVPFGIALDGYVKGPPCFDRNGRGGTPRETFNHHEGVDPIATRSTCAQVLMALRQDLFDTFRDGDGPRAYIYVNDCDEDVATAWTLLKHHYMADLTMNPILNRLVAMEDMLDCTAGAYPYPKDLPMLRELAWVFEPYRQFRLSGELDKKDARSYKAVIEGVELRIMKHITGVGEEISLNTDFKVERQVGNWVFVHEIGAQARTGMFANKIRQFVSVRGGSNGKWTYAIGKMGRYQPVDMELLAVHLNVAEGISPTSKDTWGGRNTIIGSPRVAASHLNPDQLAEALVSFEHEPR
jgi:hypothetical protein